MLMVHELCLASTVPQLVVSRKNELPVTVLLLIVIGPLLVLLSVTTLSALWPAPYTIVPKSSCCGATAAVGAIPVPERLAVIVPPEPPVKLADSVVLSGPTVEGVKVTWKLHVELAASDVPHGLAGIVKSVLLPPVVAIARAFMATGLVLFSVIVQALLIDCCVWLPKLIAPGVNDPVGVFEAPTPVRLSV